MGPSERRIKLLRLLSRRRSETITNLAKELEVSSRTVRRDIDALSQTTPIYTKTGRYGGGVYLMDTYYSDKSYLTEAELNILERLYDGAKHREVCMLKPDELRQLRYIIENYTKPTIRK